jgi:2-dehydropantoate 2-reductase
VPSAARLALISFAQGGRLSSSIPPQNTSVEFNPALRPLVTALVSEVLVVCSSEDIIPERFQDFNPTAFVRGDRAGIDGSLTSLAAERRRNNKLRSGIWRDLAVRKRKTEVREQFAPIQATARRNGVEIPTIGTLVDLVHDVELGKREIGPSLAEELIARAARCIEGT